MNFVTVIGEGKSWLAISEELNAMGKKWVRIKVNLDELFGTKKLTVDEVDPVDETILPESPEELLRRSESFIFLSDLETAKNAGVQDPDMWVARNLKIIHDKMKGYSESVRLIAEARLPEHEDILKKMGADEVICVEAFGGELLAQAIRKPAIVEMFKELIKTKKTTNEIYFDDLPDQDAACKNFGEISRFYLHDLEAPIDKRRIPIGIWRGHEVILNPFGSGAKLLKDDKIIVVAYSEQ